MSHITAIVTTDGNLLFNESTGSSHFNDEYVLFDTDSGKYYRTLFDLEQAFYESKIYSPGSPPDPPVIESLNFEPLKMCYTPTPVNIIGQMSSIVPTLTQRLDGTWATTFTTTPTNIYDLEF